MKPLDEAAARLDDYVRGALDDTEAETFEEELFARALRDEAPELTFREDLRRTFQAMKERGTIDIWLTERGLAELIASGAKVRRYDLDPAQPAKPDLSGDFDIFVTRVPIPLEDVEQLEAEVLSPDGQVLKVMPDITFERTDGAIYACCERELAIAAARAPTVTRLWARETGGRRLLAELRSDG